MLDQLKSLALRLEELETQLAQPETYADPEKLAKLTKEQKDLTPIVDKYRRLQATDRELAGLTDLLTDPECRDLARAEYDGVKAQRESLEEELKLLLIPKDPMDDKSVILEIRAGVGGEEAALFAASLYRMYAMHSEKQGWRIELASLSETELGGIKEISFLV